MFLGYFARFVRLWTRTIAAISFRPYAYLRLRPYAYLRDGDRSFVTKYWNRIRIALVAFSSFGKRFLRMASVIRPRVWWYVGKNTRTLCCLLGSRQCWPMAALKRRAIVIAALKTGKINRTSIERRIRRPTMAEQRVVDGALFGFVSPRSLYSVQERLGVRVPENWHAKPENDGRGKKQFWNTRLVDKHASRLNSCLILFIF